MATRTVRTVFTTPAGYFLTFRCYGTWLPGDERGTIHSTTNEYGTAMLPPSPRLEDFAAQSLSTAPILLNAAERRVVSAAIQELCEYRDWPLHAENARSNHVHVVLTCDAAPEKALNEIKSWCTRRLREQGLRQHGKPVWGKGGSRRYLWTAPDVATACRYVLEEQ